MLKKTNLPLGAKKCNTKQYDTAIPISWGSCIVLYYKVKFCIIKFFCIIKYYKVNKLIKFCITHKFF